MGSRLFRRFQRRRDRVAVARSSRLFPLVALVLFGASAAVLVLLNVSGAATIGRPPILACLGVVVVYAARIRTLRIADRP